VIIRADSGKATFPSTSHFFVRGIWEHQYTKSGVWGCIAPPKVGIWNCDAPTQSASWDCTGPTQATTWVEVDPTEQ